MTVVPYRERLSTNKNAPAKRLTKGGASTGGRNSAGRTTTHYRGGGNKRVYREIDFRFDKRGVPATVETIEYDPYRSAFVSLVCYADGERRYILTPKGLKEGATFTVSEDAKVATGNRLPLGKIPSGTFVCSVELKPGAGARLARAAGGHAEIVAHDAGYTQLKMPSSEIRKVSSDAWATVGEIGNSEHHLEVLGKAGRARYRGLRPKTRGSAKNAVDHPHGGGEGKAMRGHRRARTAQGRPTGKGQKTRRPKKYSNKLIVNRRKPGKLMTSKK